MHCVDGKRHKIACDLDKEVLKIMTLVNIPKSTAPTSNIRILCQYPPRMIKVEVVLP